LTGRADEAVVVVLVGEDAGAAMAAVQGRVAIATDGSSCGAKPEEIFLANRPEGKKVATVGADGADTSMGRRRRLREEL
jgi:hypothetical protein